VLFIVDDPSHHGKSYLGKKKTVIIASIALAIMFITMLIINSCIDGQRGKGVLELQLSFNKEKGIAIVGSWGANGPGRFNKLIVFDYLYAVSYSFFLASTLSLLILKHGLDGNPYSQRFVYLPFIAGTLDWVENAMEIPFVNHPETYPDFLFYLHSIVAVTKWAIVGIAVLAISLLWVKKNRSPAAIQK
jgi:hypothetical protein